MEEKKGVRQHWTSLTPLTAGHIALNRIIKDLFWNLILNKIMRRYCVIVTVKATPSGFIAAIVL